MYEKFRFLTSGESHGKCLTAIIDGLPAGFTIDPELINAELKRRQGGYGRSERMDIEDDKVEITSGVRFGKTTGAPVTLVIYNCDYKNWEKVMSIHPEDETDEKSFTKYRPGHADLAGSVKYNHKDLRNVLERSSARKTAIETAVGAVAKQILAEFNIRGYSRILKVGSVIDKNEFHAEIDRARAEGDTVGGRFAVLYENMPIGLGSYSQWDRTLDSRIGQALMSIPAVKTVYIGNHHSYHLRGSEFHDQLFVDEYKRVVRETNNAGGIEGGMTNGENLQVFASMKPIPTMQKTLKTVDSATGQEAEAHYERSDTCAVEACAVIAEAKVACVLLNELMLKFGGDHIAEMKRNYETAVREISFE